MTLQDIQNHPLVLWQTLCVWESHSFSAVLLLCHSIITSATWRGEVRNKEAWAFYATFSGFVLVWC